MAPLSAISTLLGRDHSTVCYALQRVEALRESSPEIDCLVSHLKAQLLGGDSILEEAEAMLLRNRHMSMRSVRAVAAREELLNTIADRVAERVLKDLRQANRAADS